MAPWPAETAPPLLALLALAKNVVCHFKRNMRNLIFTIIIILSFQHFSIGQPDFKEDKIYKIWITLSIEPTKEKGYLYKITDSTIILTQTYTTKDNSSDLPDLVEINIGDIKSIKTRTKGRIIWGATFGGVTGLVFGSIIAATASTEGDRVDKFMFYCVPLITIGAGFDALVGSTKEKIIINGNIETFNQVKKNLEKILIE